MGAIESSSQGRGNRRLRGSKGAVTDVNREQRQQMLASKPTLLLLTKHPEKDYTLRDYRMPTNMCYLNLVSI